MLLANDFFRLYFLYVSIRKESICIFALCVPYNRVLILNGTKFYLSKLISNKKKKKENKSD